MEKKRYRLTIEFLSLFALSILILAACSPTVGPGPVSNTSTRLAPATPAALSTGASSSTPVRAATGTPMPASAEAAALVPTIPENLPLEPTQTPVKISAPLPGDTPAATPTYAILRGEVLVRSNCRYGPGEPYLYKYGLVPGSNLEVIGRNDRGDWILVRAVGGDNPCWVKASLLKVKGEVMAVAPTYLPLPPSPYYGPPATALATRAGDEVTVFWTGVPFRAGDETASAPYLIEAWICRGGQLEFTPIGSYETLVRILDEPGCSEPSHARLYTVEKHGYSRWIKIPWPD